MTTVNDCNGRSYQLARLLRGTGKIEARRAGDGPSGQAAIYLTRQGRWALPYPTWAPVYDGIFETRIRNFSSR